jgi:Domain of unknown function (DUF3291)
MAGMAAHPLAPVNVATLRFPLDGPELAGFVAQLEPINALADGTPGFVWRLQTEDGHATSIRPFGDERIMPAGIVPPVSARPGSAPAAGPPRRRCWPP